MRLLRAKLVHVRAAEVLRALIAMGGVARLNTADVCAELARRGVLDPVGDFERYMGDVRPARKALDKLTRAILLLKDGGLIAPFREGEYGRRGRYMVTPEGRAALAEYDDNTSMLSPRSSNGHEQRPQGPLDAERGS